MNYPIGSLVQPSTTFTAQLHDVDVRLLEGTVLRVLDRRRCGLTGQPSLLVLVLHGSAAPEQRSVWLPAKHFRLAEAPR